jgi:serine/threonine-protein kinase
MAVAGLIVLLAGVGWWRLTTAREQASATRAIAVLPFENTSRDTASDYVVDGVANDLRAGLMTLQGLSVRARTSSEATQGRTVREAGAMLNVGLVLQGTFRRAPDHVAVTVELVNVADESALWTGKYDLPADGNFASTQDSITNAIARTLHLSASVAPTAVTQRGTNDQDAYDLYLKGQYRFARRGRDNLYGAIDNFKSAITRDPLFARAHAGLAMVYSILPAYTAVGGDSLAHEAERIARGALAIDSTLFDAHLALASAMSVQGRPLEAESEYMAALSLDPRNAVAHQWHGGNLAVLGRPGEAVREARIAVELDPLSAVASNDLTYTLITAGQFEEAILAARRGLELDASLPWGHQYLGIAYASIGRLDSASQAFNRLFRADTLAPTGRALHVWSLVFSGRWVEADRELATIEQTTTGGSHDYDVFLANLALGNRAAALEALERAVRRHSFYVTTTALGCDPTFGALRSEPRFVAMLTQLGQSICPMTPELPIPARTNASQP